MTYATMSVVVTAQHMPEAVFNEAPAVLRCLPGDLGRYKGGTQVMFVLDEFGVPLATVTRWLRGHGIRHDVEISYEWIDVPIGDDEGEDRYREDVEDIIDDFRHARATAAEKTSRSTPSDPTPTGTPTSNAQPSHRLPRRGTRPELSRASLRRTPTPCAAG